MASTSGFGIGRWVPMLGLAALPASAATLPQLSAPVPSAPKASDTIQVTINGLRSDRGVVRLMLCPARQAFPDCGHGGLPLTATIKDHAATVQFSGVAPGLYAIAAFHDENGNGRLDTFMGIPREGVGFSGNPSVRMRAPTFSECDFTVAQDTATKIAIKYLF